MTSPGLLVSSYITRYQEVPLGYQTKVQLIQRKASEQWYVNFPAVLARAMEFTKGEVVEWIVDDKDTLTLRRSAAAAAQRTERRPKKKR